MSRKPAADRTQDPDTVEIRGLLRASSLRQLATCQRQSPVGGGRRALDSNSLEMSSAAFSWSAVLGGASG
jgi:hypothetical protein